MASRNKKFSLADAIAFYVPQGTEWVLRGNAYDGIEIHTEGVTIPDEETLWRKVEELQAEYDRNEYQRKRADEYPPVSDYLDAIVKGDQAQVQAYIDACLAVKAKYPKPE